MHVCLYTHLHNNYNPIHTYSHIGYTSLIHTENYFLNCNCSFNC